MDYQTNTVGICICFCVFEFKNYLFLLAICNIIKGVILDTLGGMSLLEIHYLMYLELPIQISMISFGTITILLQIPLLIYLRKNNYILMKPIVVINILLSLIDFAVGTLLLIIAFAQFDLILSYRQINYIYTNKNSTAMVGSSLVIIGLLGFWMTYLQYKTIHPLELLNKQVAVISPEEDIKDALQRRFNRKLTDTKVQDLSQQKSQTLIPLNSVSPMNGPMKSDRNDFTTPQHRLSMIQQQEAYYPSAQSIRIPSIQDDAKLLKRPQQFTKK